MTTDSISMKDITRRAYLMFVMAVVGLAVVFFLPAGTLGYWHAWVYMGLLLIPMVFVLRYLLRNSPHLLERRMQMRERELTQKRVVGFSAIYFLAAFALPGFDYRWGWSTMPVWVVLLADLAVLVGYGLIIRVFVENQYASRTVEVATGQQVISTGPYAVVRHPMYVGVLLMYLASPMALGSWWALLPAAFILPILVVRIVNEEQVLERDLPGYREYKLKTRYRLLPGVW
jgi:protein-S-isoprenylcysteine O-methyltransferase Ste14